MKNQNIIASLATATVTVLGTGLSEAQLGEADLLGTDFKGSLLYYTESDRVTAIEAIIEGQYRLSQIDTLGVKLVVDSLTGASASGAVASDFDQTFTTPSGNGTYVTRAGETPLDTSFLDTRYSLSPTWTRQWDANYETVLGANISKEYDYFSLSANALVNYTTNDRNRTYSAGFTIAQDSIDPEGGLPIAFGIMRNQGGLQPRLTGDEDKTTLDLLLGLTQVIDEKSLFQINYSLSSSDGYHSDPYKFLSVIGADGRPVIEDPATGLSRVLYENRPDSRLKHSIFAKYKRDFSGDVLDASYRFMFDDWGINSHTLDLKYKFRINDTSYLQPHLRYYMQSEADFYQPFIISGSEPVAGDTATFASADYRLGELSGFTAGLEYGRDNVDRPWSIAVEYYLQSLGTVDRQFGELLNQDLSEDVSAIMLKFNMDF
ncbi:MAG: DUF3570 domain-containing protein [Akkermansiaceae bacterium]